MANNVEVMLDSSLVRAVSHQTLLNFCASSRHPYLVVLSSVVSLFPSCLMKKLPNWIMHLLLVLVSSNLSSGNYLSSYIIYLIISCLG